MCLFVTSLKKKRLQFVNGKRTCYKILQYDSRNNILKAAIRGTPYKSGYNIAQGELRIEDTSWSGTQEKKINGGAIHVFTSRKVALQELRDAYGTEDGYAVIEVICLEKDLIAEGTNSEAAFKKIFIPKENYQKCLKLAKQRYLTELRY